MAKDKDKPDLSPEQLLRLERRAKALELRKQGFSFDLIAKELGVSTPRAYNLVKEELEKISKRRTETAEEMLQLELLRLDEVIRFMWDRAKIKGDPRATEQILKAMERKAKLLGLDAPEKKAIQVDLLNRTQEELESEAQRLGLVVNEIPKGELPYAKKALPKLQDMEKEEGPHEDAQGPG